jgi:hypothetical protein
MTTLIERALLAEVAKLSHLWTLDSPRIWYETQPFRCEDGVAAYRRYEVAAVFIEDVGIGVVADVSTAFFAEQTLAYFFDSTIAHEEWQVRETHFTMLTGRQQGQKGTLLYDNGSSKISCYFDEAPPGLTCGSTGPLTVKGKRYSSVYHYYREQYPSLDIEESMPAVRVSFRGLDRPQPVAAHLVRPRVMNENVPESLASVDKIEPAQRRRLLMQFWSALEPHPLRRVAPGLMPGFWRPDAARVYYFLPPAVEFADGHRIPAPTDRSRVHLRSYYRNRLDFLHKGYCYRLPPIAPRMIYCAYPEAIGEATAEQFADDVVKTLSTWTRRPFTSDLVMYRTASEAYDKLRRADAAGMVLFILKNEPAAYYDAAFNLPGWRVKRVTDAVLKRHVGYLDRGAWDKKRREYSHSLGRQRWNSFIELNALDVLQQLDAVPYRIDQAGPYDAQLVIDVGHDRRFFSVSLLVCRGMDKTPSFAISSSVHHKPDHQREIINPILLRDAIVDLFTLVMRRTYDAIGALLVLRDGKLQEAEFPGIHKALDILHGSGVLQDKARVDIVGIHKGTQDHLRLWEIDSDEQVLNPLEGTGVLMTRHMFLLASTGEATLTQGTADPLLLVGNGQCSSIADAGHATFAAAQLNWSNPRVAQRLPLPHKRTDEELSARAAQEIRRIR